MEIEINNLGPILKFNFYLEKDLSLIFGSNNIGKSYAITTIYLLLKTFTNKDLYKDYSLKNSFELSDKDPYFEIFNELKLLQEKVSQSFKANKNTKLEITTEIAIILISFLEKIFMENLTNSFKNTFSSIDHLTNKFSNNKMSLKIKAKEFELNITNFNKELKIESLTLLKPIFVQEVLESAENNVFYFDINHINLSLITSKIIFGFFDNFFKYCNNVYFLPASRSGLYQGLNSFGPIISELSKNRSFLKNNKITLPNLSEPVSDYFLSLSNANNDKITTKFLSIIKELENNIIDGEIKISSESNKIVFHSIKNNLELELPFTSSMISEIAPIITFLKYIIDDNNTSSLIFIEEPEAHLHPLIQVKLLEIFCLLTKTNFDKSKIKLIMTTHSNYMFNKLSNLILERKIEYEKVGSYLMKMTETGSITDNYEMNSTIEGIEDLNFADVAEQLYEERISIYDKLNQNAN